MRNFAHFNARTIDEAVSLLTCYGTRASGQLSYCVPEGRGKFSLRQITPPD